MGRSIKITITDDEKKMSVDGHFEMDGVIKLFNDHGINGIVEGFIEINHQLNKATDDIVELPFKSHIHNLPLGKSW